MSTIITVYHKKPINVGMQIVQREMTDAGVNVKRPFPFHESVQSFTRQFSEGVHGPSYREIAKEYCNTHAAEIDHVEGLQSEGHDAAEAPQTPPKPKRKTKAPA